MKKSWQEHILRSGKPLGAALALICILGVIKFRIGQAAVVDQDEAASMTPTSLSGYKGTNFGNRFTLRGLDLECGSDGLDVKLAWSTDVPQQASWTNAVHLVDGAGKILMQFDYAQPTQSKDLQPGVIWLDTLSIPKGKIDRRSKNLAIGIYDASGSLLLVDKGARDWDGHRLLVHIGSCAAAR